jgi:hypothetical protein
LVCILFFVCTFRTSIIRVVITLMMEAVPTSETAVYPSETTLRCVPEAPHLRFYSMFLSDVQSCLLGYTVV